MKVEVSMSGYGQPMAAFHDLNMESITGGHVPFSRYQGHAVLVVNVASR